MTKEERAKKWFCNIPDAESISMEEKMEVCSKTAKKMAVIFFGLLILEFILLFMLSDGKIFNIAADFINSISEGSKTRNHYKGLAVAGGLVCLPALVLPLIAVFIYKNQCLKSEATKIINSMKKNDA